MTQEKPIGPGEAGQLPISDALSEASPLSLNDLSVMNPEQYLPWHIEQIVEANRGYRERYEKALKEKPVKKTKTIKDVLEVQLDGVNSGDLF